MTYSLHLIDEDKVVEYNTDVPLRSGDEVVTCGKHYRVGLIAHHLVGDGVSRELEEATVPLIRIAGNDD